MPAKKAYASVVYLRTIYDTGEVDLKFLAAKAKIAHLKSQSIPRLELLGACLMSQLVDTVRKTLQDELSHPNITTFYWVDSIAVLCWITNNKVWRPYVQNRVNSILSLSSKDDWYYCPGKLNPADLPSRGKPNLSSLWWEGPRFLKLPQSEWPQHKTEQLPPCVLSEERKSEVPALNHALASADIPPNEEVINITRFSSKMKLLRSFTWVCRFIRNLRAKVENKPLVLDSQISTEEIISSEKKLLILIQSKAFPLEIDYIQGKGKSSKVPPIVNQLNLFIDEQGVVRCKSRLRNSSVLDASITPILLPASRNAAYRSGGAQKSSP